MKKVVIGIIIGAILFGSITAYATARYMSKDILYTKTDGTVINVDEAITELYNRSSECISGVYNSKENTQWNIEVGFVPSIVNFEYSINGTDILFVSYNKSLSNKVVRVVDNKGTLDASDYTDYIDISSSTIKSTWGLSTSHYKLAYDVYYTACK